MSTNPVERFHSGSVEGLLHVPENPSGMSLVLTHGAGANSNAPLLVAVARAFCQSGWHVLRYDLPFRQQRKTGPPHPSQAAADRAGLRAACNALRQFAGLPTSIGGHSYGGRQASMLLAEDSQAASALLLLSYPLHPPDQPAKLRTGHFPALQTPAVFVHGTADPFGTPAEMEQALTLLSAPHLLTLLPGAKHDLKQGRFDITSEVIGPLASLQPSR